MTMHTITADELKTWQREHRDFQLLDVRETYEREEGHIGGVHIPLGQLEERFVELSHETPIVIYCRSGGRSQRACALLNEEGFDVYNLQGGKTAFES